MDRQDVASTYRNSTIENAPPIKIVRLLYAGALRYLDRALAEEPGDPRSKFSDLVGRADRIVCELRLALDHGPDPEVGNRLEELYLFVENRLARAVLERECEHLREARTILAKLQEAWNAVERDGIPDA